MHRLFGQSGLHRYYVYTCLCCLALILSSCAGPEPKPTGSKQTSKEVAAHTKTPDQTVSATNATGHKVAILAQGVLGSPYKYGGSSPQGFDCSGLVYYTHSQLGISVPRTTRQQARHASTLNLHDAEPGDILFFRIYGNGISHVGIYTGNNRFIHAPKSGKFVSYASIDDPFWRQRFVKAGRLH